MFLNIRPIIVTMDDIISVDTPPLQRISSNFSLSKIKYAWDMTDSVRSYKHKKVPFRVNAFVKSILDGETGKKVKNVLKICDGVLINLYPMPYLQLEHDCLRHLDIVKKLLVLLHNEEEGFIRDLSPVVLLHHDIGYIIRFDTPKKRDHILPDTPYPPVVLRRQLIGVHLIFKEFAEIVLKNRT